MHVHNGRVIKDDSCESWQHGKLCDLNPHKDMYKCYDYNHEKVHIRRIYQKEINQNNKCHVKMLAFLFLSFISKFSMTVFINLITIIITALMHYKLHIYIWHQITHYHFSS